MRRNGALLRWMLLAAAGAVALLALFVLLFGALVWATLDESERRSVAALAMPRLPLLLLVAGAVAVLAGALARPLFQRWVGVPARLLEQVRVVLSTDTRRPLSAAGASASVRGLAEAIDELVMQREQLKGDVASRIAAASRDIEQQRNRLAALMNELQQSVVVCNLDGRILLYNNRARLQFRALSDVPNLADGAELIGLGRSIYAVFDRKLVAHALERVQQRLQNGAAHPSAQFVTTTASGQLLRARLAAVRGTDSAEQAQNAAVAIDSFVLLLDNITRDYEQQSHREQLLHRLSEGSRGSLASLQAAVELLEDPAMPAEQRERFLAVIRDESQSMSRLLDELASDDEVELGTRWPLDEMLGADLVQAAQRRIESATGLRCAVADVDQSLWLKIESFSVLQVLVHLASKLRDQSAVDAVELRLTARDELRVCLDLVWAGEAAACEMPTGWELETIDSDAAAGGLTIRDVMARHAGECWFERDRAAQQSFFRLLLPAADAAAEQGTVPFVHSDSRPEYLDFDLFASTELGRELEDRPLASLAFTVFDTETTGLDPSGGDEIIQIGAVRIVSGKLLRSECFEQIIDPRRPIPAASIPIHGITPEQIVGKPTLDQVLPAFRAYAQDTVLVAHNAAFDMRFLQLKEASTGVAFDLPVLDTLLLSAVVHPNQESHRLEAIAERFGITVIGRHTALGDAMVTAEVLLKLLALLAEQGIVTLGQAREAAQKTWYARLKY
ncbi:exonuclease domain-containing protein [Piscinibacter sakaiensis]|uniref:exonuclease domain-containing protein n=1 Tax=Piscinibacter sakaiensis TaxID=1547922 RepID=UPI003AAFA9EE